MYVYIFHLEQEGTLSIIIIIIIKESTRPIQIDTAYIDVCFKVHTHNESQFT